MKLSRSGHRRRARSRSFVWNVIHRERRLDGVAEVEPGAEPFNPVPVGTMGGDETIAVEFERDFPTEVSGHRHVTFNRVNAVATDNDIITRGHTKRSAALLVPCPIVGNCPVSACQK